MPNIEQIRVAKQEMEAAIQAAVSVAMAAFLSKTGMSPSRIDINLLDITTIESSEKRYLVGEVRADVPL